jgi:hypothetical protein
MMTTKPKTGKASAAETGINPKLIALAAKLNEANTCALSLEAREDEPGSAANLAVQKAYRNIRKSEDKLARAAATNLEEMKLKARYADLFLVGDTMAKSIVRDLRALSRKPKATTRKEVEAAI